MIMVHVRIAVCLVTKCDKPVEIKLQNIKE